MLHRVFKSPFILSTSLLLILTMSGCQQMNNKQSAVSANPESATSHADSATVSPSSSPEQPPVPMKPVSSRPANEAGVIPVLEYHRITKKPSRYDRSAADFRNDLERLYREGYRPVALQEMLQGKINLPAGASPVILTFDDADVTQFRYLPDSSLDPDCAVAILQTFEQKHPDWKTHATFYVLPESAFGPAKERTKKFEYLRDKLGCEIGNHTVKHVSLRSLSDEKVQEEIGGCVQKIQKILPDTPVVSIALPMGISPKNKALLGKGMFANQPYSNTSVMLVGANPAPSPYMKSFDPMRIPRIQSVEGDAGITDWLNQMKKQKTAYVSDGDSNTVTVPEKEASKISTDRIHCQKLNTVK